jgi:hypothetical protein
MKTAERLLLVIVVVLISIAIPFHSSYAAVNITVTFEGNQTCTKTGTDKVTIAAAGTSYTCGAYTIKPKDSTKDAEVVASNGSNDSLSFLNARISRSSGSYPDLHITFSAGDFTDPPTSGASVDVWYEVRAEGFFKRDLTNNLAEGSQIKTHGYFQHPSGGSWYMLGSDPPSETGVELLFTVCGTNGCSNYIPTTYHTETHFTSLSNTRVHKGEFWVKLNNNSDSLSLTSLGVQNTAMGGARRRCDPTKQEDCPPTCPSVECRSQKQCLPHPLTEMMCEQLGVCSECGLEGPFFKKKRGESQQEQ